MVTLSVLAQLDILSAASGGAMHAVSDVVDPFVFRLSIFVLAVFVGYYVVWSVTPALHTPLMSVTNAISSVIVVGALLAVGVALVADDAGPIWARAFGFVALTFACVNIFGGFLVTQRMLGNCFNGNRNNHERQSRRAGLSGRRRPLHPGAARAVASRLPAAAAICSA